MRSVVPGAVAGWNRCLLLGSPQLQLFTIRFTAAPSIPTSSLTRSLFKLQLFPSLRSLVNDRVGIRLTGKYH
jgi:hypothetical protein